MSNLTIFTDSQSNESAETNNTHGDINLWRHSPSVTVLCIIAYSIVFVVGLVGNFFVISVVWRAPRMKNVTNLFIVNLAFADILVILLAVPGTLLSHIYVPWILGEVMCKLLVYVQGVSVMASLYSLLAVTLDRYFAICFPMKFQITTRRARVMLIFIWILALSVASPWLIYFTLVPYKNGILTCTEEWPLPEYGTVYFIVANLIFCYVFPLAIITVCYIAIFIRVFNRYIPTDSKDGHMEKIKQKSKVKVVKMLVAVVVVFALSWLPLYIVFCLDKFATLSKEGQAIIFIAAPVAQWLGLSNSCVNPILYAFFNDKYLKGFLAIIRSGSCTSRLRIEDSVRCTNTERSTFREGSCKESIKRARNVSFQGDDNVML